MKRLAAGLISLGVAVGCGAAPSVVGGSLWSAPSVGSQSPPHGRSVGPGGHAESAAEPNATGALTSAESLAGMDQAEACATLCWLTNKHCRGASLAYASIEACTDSCEALPRLGAVGAASGNSVQCRITFALLARRGQAMAFCRNAAANGGEQCND